MNWLTPILILLVAYVAVYLEATFNGIRHFLGAQIDLLPALMVYAALSSELMTIMALAVLGGLWFDSFSSNPLGISILPLFLVGYLIYPRRGLILREQYYTQLVLGLLASSIVPLMTLLMLLSGREPLVVGWGTLWQWLVMAVGGGLLTPVIFRLFDGLHYALSYRPVVETSFRMDRELRRGRK
ncbi:MAG TPA: hypothetical protein VFB72_09505 [Verrucomicrobiae bacterium]|nr:hypothetical protein [Verrucomicrobiae bacterium]